jgi:hypothetical protein
MGGSTRTFDRVEFVAPARTPGRSVEYFPEMAVEPQVSPLRSPGFPVEDRGVDVVLHRGIEHGQRFEFFPGIRDLATAQSGRDGQRDPGFTGERFSLVTMADVSP